MVKKDKTSPLGDIHNGEYVSEAVFKGQKCIRKPRSANTERAFNAFLLEMERKGFLFIPGKVDILEDSGSEHYVGITKHISVERIEEVHLYYKRCGVLLCLAYLFSSNDLHRENIIANGGFPTIIDYETLMSGDDDRGLDEKYPVMFSDSVWSSYLLPRWSRIGNSFIDLSGLTGRLVGKRDLNELAGEDNPNILFFKETPTFAWDYVDDICYGFCYTYDFFLDNKTEAANWLDVFSDCSFRVIFRRTEAYAKVTEILADYSNEQKTVGAQMLLEQAYLNDADPNRIIKVQRILDEEVRAVSNDEVPLFTVKANELSVRCRDEILCENYFKYSPIDKAKRKLVAFSSLNRDGQIKIIREAIASTTPIHLVTSKHKSWKGSELQPKKYRGHVDHERVPDECYTILKCLEEKCIEGMPDSWLNLNQGINGSVTLSGVGMGLYHGVMGILCFYAALNALTEDAVYLNRIEELYEPVHKHLQGIKVKLSDSVASLNLGMGGILSALFHLYELTGEPVFQSDAEQFFSRIDIPEHLSSGNTDYLCGYAGFAQLLKKTDNQEKARLFARTLRPALLAAEPKYTGFAHGASGYAYALGILDCVLGDELSSKTILSLMKWENKYYNTNNKNWWDIRDPNRHAFMNGWCSGAPGIIMAREELRKITSNEEIRHICEADISMMKGYFSQPYVPDHDCLCCGHAAQLMVSSRFGYHADTIYQGLLDSIRMDRLNLQHLIHTNNFIPGLMQGYAGIGYSIAMYGDKRSGGMLV